MAKKIKIGVDYHGVITTNPEFFRDFNHEALQNGCEIYILSGGTEKDINEYLRQHQISYTFIWSMLDHFAQHRQVKFFDDGSFKVKEKLWNEAKAKYCLENGIDFHIDDSALYGQTFETPFCLYDEHQKSCAVGGRNQCVIDFHLPPAQVLEQILSFIKQRKTA